MPNLAARARRPGKREMQAELERLRAVSVDLLITCERLTEACRNNDWSEPGISDELYDAIERVGAAAKVARATLEGKDNA